MFRTQTIGLCFVWLAVLGSVAASPQSRSTSSLGPITIGEGVLRANATRIIMPEYPKASSQKQATGVAVVQLETTEDGRVEKVEILEAPDQSIAKAVEAAVSQWQFNPTSFANRKRRIKGKLTFYFKRVGNHFEVHNPVGY